MKTRILHNEGNGCAVVYVDDLVLTVSHSPSQGYEVLVEVDGDESAVNVPVSIGNAVGESVEWEL